MDQVRPTGLTVVFLLAVPAICLAQSTAGLDSLPADPILRQLIDESLAARPELKQAEVTVTAERERVPQAGALPDPVLSLGIQNDGFRSIQVGKMETSYYQVMISQGLPWPGKRGLREDVARLAASQADASVVRLRLGTEADVRRTYLDLMVVRERLALLDDLEHVWQRSIGTARARYESGDGSQSDVMRAQLELNRIQQQRWAMKAEDSADVQALNRLRGHPLEEPIGSGMAVRNLPLPEVPDLEPAAAEAEALSPELAEARTAARQAEAQVRLARRERFPNFSVQVGIMPRGGLEPMWTAGVSIGLPIWSGRKQERAVAENEERSSAAADGAEAIDQVLRLRVAERRSALASLLETLRIYRQGLLVLSKATTESTLAQYRVGKVTFASVLEANAGYLADQDAYLLASADAQRIAIASAEVSLDPVGASGAGGGLGGTSGPRRGRDGRWHVRCQGPSRRFSRSRWRRFLFRYVTQVNEMTPPDPTPPPARSGRRFGGLSVFLIALLAAGLGVGGSAIFHRSSEAQPAIKVNRKILFYRNPMGQPDTSPVPKKDEMGMDYLPVYAEEVAGNGGGASAAVAKVDRRILFYRNPMGQPDTSPVPKKDEMGMDYLPVYADELGGAAAPVEGLATVNIDPSRQQLIGLRTAAVEMGRVGGAWRTNGKVAEDESLVHHVNLKVGGFVGHTHAEFVGQEVKKGDPLFSLYSPELLAAQDEYVLALRTRDQLRHSGSTSGDGDDLVASARRKLELWDLPEAELKHLEETGQPTKDITFLRSGQRHHHQARRAPRDAGQCRRHAHRAR